MEHKGQPSITSLALEPWENFRGFGENESEILVTRLADEKETQRVLGRFGQPETGAVLLVDDMAQGPLHKTLQWFGCHMIYRSERMNFNSLEHCTETLADKLSEKLHIKLDYRGFNQHCKTLSDDIAASMATICRSFNLESGFQLDLSKEKLTEPEWHVDILGDGGLPCSRFVRFVRVPHVDGTYIALCQKEHNVFATGNAHRSYGVRDYAMGGGSGLYAIKGNRIHSPPIPSNDKPRTVYTITPYDCSPTVNFRMK